MGESIGIIMVSGIVAVMVLGTIGGLVIGFVKAMKGGSSKKARKEDREETALIQEMHRGLMKMAERVESLETLVVNDDRYKSAEFERKLNED